MPVRKPMEYYLIYSGKGFKLRPRRRLAEAAPARTYLLIASAAGGVLTMGSANLIMLGVLIFLILVDM